MTLNMNATPETVWTLLQEMAQRAEASKAEHDRMIAESAAQMKAMSQETEKKFQEIAEQQKKTDEQLKKLSRTVGGMYRTQGKLMEAMYSARLWDKFATLGFAFTQGCRERVFRENGQKVAAVDVFLENGQYAMAVEVKTKLTTEDVNDHVERITKVRKNMDDHGDKRTLVGAVAGGISPDNVIAYAQKNGLYAVVWSGKSAAIAEAPPTFKAREW
ncbi:MAG: hypothetical protein LBS82_05690 [Spirochaetaceae bacterium]|jgi:hypothetical protein|nr:hypothetical protein [Spirochaetaceae bacterium]